MTYTNSTRLTSLIDFRPDGSLLIGGERIALEEFLSKPVKHQVCTSRL